VHERSGNAPHLAFRKRIIEGQRKHGGRTLAVDSNLFLYHDPRNVNQYLRFSLDGVFPTSGEYFWDSQDPARWQKIKQDLGIDLKPWRKNGDHILICLQRNGGWSMGNYDVMQWCSDVVKTIRRRTSRPIVVRTHPGDKKATGYIRSAPQGVQISRSSSIVDDLNNCWACVTYNSSPGVAAAIEGVPVFVTDKTAQRSQAYDIANLNLEDINQPKTSERQQWIEKISMSHYSFRDLTDGTAWNTIKDYI